MREGIHPQYYQATVTCNCGNTFVTGPLFPRSTSKFAPSAILSILASRRQQMLRVALISSTRNTVLNKIVISSDDGGWSRRLPQPLCFYHIQPAQVLMWQH